MLLGVNIDHIAVLREARAINDPNLLDALGICKLAGADQITIHLREDRRHIHDNDLKQIIELSALPINLECSINDDIIDIACKYKPTRVTLVPENRQEVTTEGGLDCQNNFKKIQKAVDKLHKNNIEVSLFIDPCKDMIDLSKMLDVKYIELHTGSFANIYAMLYSNLSQTHNSIKELELPKDQLEKKFKKSIKQIKKSSKYAKKLGLLVAAGHGINYQNIKYITPIKDIFELNIGQSIVARSVFTGLYDAIIQIKDLCNPK
jgi:pyridoxine 5-phosphate synthase